MTDADLSKAMEVVKDRLYYVTVRAIPSERHDAHFFTVDDTLHYWPFFLDYGPLSLGNLFRFCQIVNAKLSDKLHASKRIYLYSGPHMHRRANAVYLLSAYSLLCLGRSPEDAYRPFAYISPPLAPWHDASPSVDSFHLNTLEVLRGIAKAQECHFFSFDAFDIEEYEHYEKVEHGDMNWIVEGRFLAFAGPHDSRVSAMEGYHTTSVDDVVPYFKARGIAAVVRLNKKYYNERRFTAAGIEHYDMYYLDGSNPPEAILQRFLATAEATSGAIAVHCKAGLGRTGTCIGAYLMKHYRFSAREVIGWMRVCRPGSVIGPQQQFLEELQPRMWEEGEAFRRIKRLPVPVVGSLLARSQAALAKTFSSGSVSESTRGVSDGTVDSTSDLLSSLSIGASSPSGRSSSTAFVSTSGRAPARLSSKSTLTSEVLPTIATTTPVAGRRSGTTSPTGSSSFNSLVNFGRPGVSSSGRDSETPPRASDDRGGYPLTPATSTTAKSFSASGSGPSGSGYASPGSSPISSSLMRARTRTLPSERDYEAATGAAAMPPSQLPSSRYTNPTVSPLSVPAGGSTGTPKSSSVLLSGSRGGGGAAPSFASTPTARALAAGGEEYSQGDALRSAKSRSPMMTSPGGLRFAGSGVVATTPKSPGFSSYSGASGSGVASPVAVGGAPSPSRFSLRGRP